MGPQGRFFSLKNKKNNSYFLLGVKLVQSKSQGEDIKFVMVHSLSQKYWPNGAFTLEVKSVLNENLGGTQCEMGHSLMVSEC
jgi:hypothetical protein